MARDFSLIFSICSICRCMTKLPPPICSLFPVRFAYLLHYTYWSIQHSTGNLNHYILILYCEFLKWIQIMCHHRSYSSSRTEYLLWKGFYGNYFLYSTNYFALSKSTKLLISKLLLRRKVNKDKKAKKMLLRRKEMKKRTKFKPKEGKDDHCIYFFVDCSCGENTKLEVWRELRNKKHVKNNYCYI